MMQMTLTLLKHMMMHLQLLMSVCSRKIKQLVLFQLASLVLEAAEVFDSATSEMLLAFQAAQGTELGSASMS